MALFLQESTQENNAPVSLHEAMDALLEFANEQAMMNEALLRADFVIHEQTRVLREAGDEDTAGKKEKGFMGKAWALLKELVAKAKAMIVKIYTYIKQKVQQFWAYVKKQYAGAKKFVISKSKKAWAYACAKAAQARIKLATALVSGGMKIAGADHPEFAQIEAGLTAAKAITDAADSMSDSDLHALEAQLSAGGAEAAQLVTKLETAVAKGGDNAMAAALRGALDQAKKAASESVSGLQAMTTAKGEAAAA